MTDMIHTGAGNYYLNVNYSTNGVTNVFVVDLTTMQPIANLNLAINDKNAALDFSLDKITPIALAVVLSSATTNFTLHKIRFGKR